MNEPDRKDCPFRETCMQIQERAIARKDFAEARLGEAWKGAKQQNKGMNRMARKIKRLQTENKRLMGVIDTCGMKLQIMLRFGQITPRYEIDQLLAELKVKPDGVGNVPTDHPMPSPEPVTGFTQPQRDK